MDAVAVEGRGGIAEQERRARFDPNGALGRRPRARRRRRSRSGLRDAVAIDDVLPLRERQASRSAVGVGDGDEQERAAAAVLKRDVVDARTPGDFVADAQRRTRERQLAAGPHAPRQRDGRQKTAARGCPSGPRADIFAMSGARHQWIAVGASAPSAVSPSSSNTARRLAASRGVITSSASAVWPIQVRRRSMSINVMEAARQYERGMPSTCSARKLRIRLVEIGAT